MSHMIVLSGLQSVLKQGKAVSPMAELETHGSYQDNHDTQASTQQPCFGEVQSLSQVGCPPDQNDKQTHQRDVGISIGHGVPADLDETADRKQSA